MNDFIDNLAYEVFSILLVVFLVLVLYVAVKRKMGDDEEPHERGN